MSWSDVIYKLSPFREEVVQDTVLVVHDALLSTAYFETSYKNIFSK